MLKIRRSHERGPADHGWLKSQHTFSFGDYHDDKHMGVSVLRVINEDRIEGGTGFQKHSHRDMEIISYVLEGALEHKDSMGTSTTILPGEVQRMSAGSGVQHSEHNHLKNDVTHFFQIWILPEAKNLKPSYGQMDFSEKLKTGSLFLAVSKNGRENSISMNQDANLYLAKPKKGAEILLPVHASRRGWLQLAQGKILLEGSTEILEAGDGVEIASVATLNVTVVEDSHFFFFDLPRENIT